MAPLELRSSPGFGGPIARMTQEHTTMRYLEGVRTHVARAA
jgi:hypothetical protein